MKILFVIRWRKFEANLLLHFTIILVKSLTRYFAKTLDICFSGHMVFMMRYYFLMSFRRQNAGTL